VSPPTNQLRDSEAPHPHIGLVPAIYVAYACAMKSTIYIPPSCKAADEHLMVALRRGPKTLNKAEFIRAWCSLAYLYPGLHPDGYEDKDSGWPEELKPLAAEAWRRATTGKLTDNELYCYQVCKTRLLREYRTGASEGRLSQHYVPDWFAA